MGSCCSCAYESVAELRSDGGAAAVIVEGRRGEEPKAGTSAGGRGDAYTGGCGKSSQGPAPCSLRDVKA